jgi:hypothetical protein
MPEDHGTDAAEFPFPTACASDRRDQDATRDAGEHDESECDGVRQVAVEVRFRGGCKFLAVRAVTPRVW